MTEADDATMVAPTSGETANLSSALNESIGFITKTISNFGSMNSTLFTHDDDFVTNMPNLTRMNSSNLDVSDADGYILPLYGLDDGLFYYLHVPALACLFASFISAIIALVLSFKQKSYKTFFRWSKSERFIVYLAACDGLYCVAHAMDHLHMVLIMAHVNPKPLCEFYGFILAVFVTAQNLIVNIVAVNVFLMMYFERKLKFGRFDWKFIVWTFGVPVIGAASAAALGQFGPTGAFCSFDGIKGRVANLCFTTIPLLVIFGSNVILYILTWKKIRDQTATIKKCLGTMTANARASTRAARAMSLFVVAFFVQWWALALYGAWGLFDPRIPKVMFHLVTTFSNIGGVLNLIVLLVIRRRQRKKSEGTSAAKTAKRSTSDGAGTMSSSCSVNTCSTDVSFSVNDVTSG